MKPEIAALIEKAERSIASAKLQLDHGYPDFAVGRTYYAMFYVAEAILKNRDLVFSSHGAVQGAFGKEIIKAGLMDAKYHRYLLDAFRQRQEADYNTDKVSTESARDLIQAAEEFIAAAKTSSLLD